MKFIAGLIILGFFGQAWAFKTPDILVDSKLDYNWSSFLVSRFRILATNYGHRDPFKASFPGSIIVTEEEVGEFLNDDSLSLLTDLGNVIGLNLVDGETKVEVHGFSYDVKNFKTDLKASEVHKDGLVLATTVSASGLTLSADKVTLSLVIPTRSGDTATPVLDLEIIRPVIHAKRDRLINFFSQLKIQDKHDHFGIELQQADFSRMARTLLNHPELVELSYDRIVVPEVSIRIGSKQVNFSPEKIDQAIRKRHEAIKGLLVAQVSSTLRKELTASLAKVVDKFKLNKEWWISDKLIMSQIEISQFTNSLADNHVEVQSVADFCTAKSYNKLKKSCLNNKITKTSESRLSERHYKTSLQTMKDLMENGDANLVASISEDYLNKLLVTTYDAGLWKEALDEAGVALGPNKVVLHLNKVGDSGTLVMDVIYKPKGIERLATGAKTIRFPLVLDVSVRIERHDNEPVIIVRLNDVDLSEETLLKGKPEHNMISTIKDVPRLKKQVIKAIQKQVISLKNKDIIELRYPELRGLGLEHVDFLSDGHGRMNAMMKLEDLIPTRMP